MRYRRSIAASWSTFWRALMSALISDCTSPESSRSLGCSACGSTSAAGGSLLVTAVASAIHCCVSMRFSVAAGVVEGRTWGLELRSRSLSAPSARSLATHL